MPVNRAGRYGVALLVCALGAFPLSAREIWVVRFETQWPEFPPCRSLQRWFSHLMFTNTTSQEQTVMVLEASNGGLRTDARPLRLLPGRTVSLQGASTAQLNWEPAAASPGGYLLWVNKLEVPAGVVFSARGELHIFEPASADPAPPCTGINRYSAGLPLPVIEHLVNPGVPEHHLGVDPGSRIGLGLDSRINVGVFNASSGAARVTIDVRCSQVEASLLMGSDPLLIRTALDVPPDTLQQHTIVMSTRAAQCPLTGSTNPYHVVVTSDRPGFSYAVGLVNDQTVSPLENRVPGTFPANISVTH